MRKYGRYIKHLMLVTAVAGAFAALMFLCMKCNPLTEDMAGDAGMKSGRTSKVLPIGIRYTRQHPLVIVADMERRPYSFVNDKGEPDGMHVELLKHIFGDFHINYEIHLLDNKTCQKELAEGHAQVMIDFSSLPVPQNVTMSSVSLGTYHVAVLRLRTTPRLRSMLELKESDTLLVKENVFTERFINQYFNNHPPFGMKSMPYTEAIRQVSDGIAKYYVTGEQQLRRTIKRFRYNDRLVADPFDIIEGDFRMFSTDPYLFADIDKRIAKMQQTGELEPVYQRWLTDSEHSGDKHMVNELSLIVLLVITIVCSIAVTMLLRVRAASHQLKKEFLSIMDIAADMSDSRMVACNVADKWVYNILGEYMPKKGMSLEAFENNISPGDFMTYRSYVNRLSNSGEEMGQFFLRMRLPEAGDGWRLIRHYMGRQFDNVGNMIYGFVTMNDVTDDEKRRERLNQKLMQYGGLESYSGYAMAHYDRNGYFSNCNDIYFRFFGQRYRGQGEMYVRNVRLRELCQELGDIPLRPDMSVDYCTSISIDELELRADVEVKISSVMGEGGKHQGYIVIINDMTRVRDMYRESKKLQIRQEELNTQQQRIATEIKYLMWHNHFVMFHWHVGDRFFDYSSDTNVYGRKTSFDGYLDQLQEGPEKEEARKMLSHPEILFAKDGHLVRKLDKSKVVGVAVSHDFSPSSPDMAWIDLYWGSHYDDDGKLTGIHGVIIDNTELKLQRQQMQREKEAALNVDRDKQVFLQNMTHELRTPLNAVNGFAEMLLLSSSSEERSEYVGIMMHNIRLLFSLVDNILTISTIEVEGIHVNKEKADFAQVFKTRAPLLGKYVYNDNVAFHVDTPLQHLPAFIDVDKTFQILEIFVNNAAKFTQQGRIHIGYRCLDNVLCIYCRDTGQGIEAGFKDKMYDRFSKADPFMPGIGLGLPLAKSIAEAIGGQLECYSEPGQGTTMSLVLNIGEEK